MPELRAEKWEKMYVSEKVEVFQECERRISAFEEREAVDILAVNMSELAQTHEQCKGCDAALIMKEDGQEVVLDDCFLSEATPYQAFEKYTHEAAHVYQTHAMDNPREHPNEHELNEWKEARATYAHQKSFREYRDNALEVDARCFSESCSRELEQTHEVQRAQEQLGQELNHQLQPVREPEEREQ